MVEGFSLFLIWGVFLAGILTAFLPCTFPVVIGYIGILVGSGNKSKIKVLRIFFLFFLGFTLTYAILGSIAGLFGYFSSTTLTINNIFSPERAAFVTGLFLILMGLFVLRLVPLPGFLKGIKSIKFPKFMSSNSWLVPLFAGFIFAAGWSPCIGPVLGGVLFLAASSQSVLSGVFLLVVFSIGLFIPILILSLCYSWLKDKLHGFSKYTSFASLLVGIILILLGLAFMFGELGFLSSYYPSFLIDYL